MTVWNPLLWDWASIVQSIFGAGVGAGIVSLYRDHRQTKSEASHLAGQLAVMLEGYAASCQQFIEANANAYQAPDEQYPDWSTRLPKLPPYPEDVEGWRALDPKLRGRCLNLPNKIAGSQSVVDANIEIDFEVAKFGSDEHAASRGIEAWEIAEALRKKYGLDGADSVWDYAEALRAAKGSTDQLKLDRAAADAKMIEGFTRSVEHSRGREQV